MHAFKWDLEHDMHIYETRIEISLSAGGSIARATRNKTLHLLLFLQHKFVSFNGQTFILIHLHIIFT